MSNSTDASSAAAQIAAFNQDVKDNLSRSPFLNIGAYMFVFSVGLILYGMMLQALFNWMSQTRSERKHVKIILWWSCFVTTATTVFMCYVIFELFIYGFGFWIPFISAKYISVFTVLDIATILPVQVFYAERAYNLLHRRKWPLALIVLGLCGEAVGGITLTVRAQSLTSYQQLPVLKGWFFLWVVSTVYVDLSITGFIIYGLHSIRTGWTNTDRIVLKLIRASVESQLPSTITAVAFLINYAYGGEHLFVVSWELYRPTLYIVMMLALLNSRDTLQNELTRGGVTNANSNTYALKSSRHHQLTQLDQIQVITERYEQSFVAPIPLMGLNRQSHMSDKDSFDRSMQVEAQNLDYQDNASQTALQVEVR